MDSSNANAGINTSSNQRIGQGPPSSDPPVESQLFGLQLQPRSDQFPLTQRKLWNDAFWVANTGPHNYASMQDFRDRARYGLKPSSLVTSGPSDPNFRVFIGDAEVCTDDALQKQLHVQDAFAKSVTVVADKDNNPLLLSFYGD